MVTTKLLIQSFLGVGAFASVIGGGVWMNSFDIADEKSHIMLLLDNTAANETAASEYYCKISSTATNNKPENQTDNSCQAYELEDSSATEVLDLSKVTGTTAKGPITFTSGKKYVLKLNKSKFDNLKDHNPEISVIKKEATSEKVLTKFTPKIIFGNDVANPTSNLIIAKTITVTTPTIAVTINETNKYFCEFETPTSITGKFECSVYPITDANTLPTAATKSTSTSNITKDKKFVIDLTNKPTTVNDLRNAKIKLFTAASATSTATKIATFSYEQALVGDLEASSKFVYKISHGWSTYYLKQAVDVSTDSLTQTELATSASNVTTKHYKCQVADNTSTFDETCELFEMTDFDGTKKTVTSTQAKATSTSITLKEKLVKNKYYKLVINQSNLNNLSNWNGEEKSIDIVSNTEPSKKYTSLKIVAKENEDNPIGKTQYVVGSATTAATLVDATTLTCEISDNNAVSDKACDVYKFTTQPTSTTKKHEDLKMTEATKISTTEAITTDNYYLVDLKAQKLDFAAFTGKTIKVTKTGTDTPVFSIIIKSPVLADLNATITNNKAIFLN